MAVYTCLSDLLPAHKNTKNIQWNMSWTHWDAVSFLHPTILTACSMLRMRCSTENFDVVEIIYNWIRSEP